MYSIGQFAEKIGKSPKTLRTWDSQEKLIAHRAPSGHRYYTEQQLQEYLGTTPESNGKNVAYCRVSTNNQKADLDSQKEYIADFCRNAGIPIDDWEVDIGSGLNYKRKRFNEILKQVPEGHISKIIVAHPDRFVRFGYDWFKDFCARYGCSIITINDERLSPQEEVVKDLISIIHVFSCRIYGLRKYKSQLKKEL